MPNQKTTYNITPANRVNQISEYYFSKKLKEVADMNARGLNVISLGIGSPDRPPHPETIETLCRESRKDNTHATNRMWVFPNYGRHLPSGIKNGTE